MAQDPWDAACDTLERLLDGPARSEIVARAHGAGDVDAALGALRGEMRAHLFRTGDGVVALKPAVKAFQRRTREEGFRVLHDWDGAAERFHKEIVPVDMLDYARRLHASGRSVADPLPVLLDYYALFVLGLVLLRAWDGDDPDRRMERVTRLVALLQGPDGSGHRFVGDAETLFWIAVSNYHPDDAAYDRLLEKVRTLGPAHRLRFARVGAGILGSHLRWGFEAYYKRDLGLLRRDNFADYPWLLFSLVTLMERWVALEEAGDDEVARRRVAEAILNGLTSDPPAFVGEAPEALAAHREEQGRFARLFREHRERLLADFKAVRPSEDAYTPLAFHFNFPHNVLKARMGMVLAGEAAPEVTLDALCGAGLDEVDDASLTALAEALTDYSRRNPEHIGRRRVMVIAYSMRTARRIFRSVLWAGEDGGDEPGAETGAGRLRLSPFQRGSREPGEGARDAG